MIQFHETRMGKQFFEGRLPALIEAVQSLSENLKPRETRQEVVPPCYVQEYLDKGYRYVGSFNDHEQAFVVVEIEKGKEE